MARPRSFGLGVLLGASLGALLGVGLAFGLVQASVARGNYTWAPVPVLVAAREVAAGATLTDADLVESTFPEPLVTQSCATPETRDRFVGKPVRWRLLPGVVLRDTDLIGTDARCAERVAEAVGQLDGGAGPLEPLTTALLRRHGGAR
ncbi:MAG: SAF domain-containing protein [Myxococcus sp.]|nr:SAF domain-containing protein [Myxococcus sp.]